MKKTRVYLDEEHLARVRWVARIQGRPQAEVLRDAIVFYAEHALPRSDRSFALFAVAEGPGGSIADIPNAELLAGFGE